MQPSTDENFFGISGLEIIKGSPPRGCKEVRAEKYNLTIKGSTSVQEVTRYVRKCCVGWSGQECDVSPPTPAPRPSSVPIIYDPTSPCANVSCAGVEDAICAVVSKCGKQRPVFLDSFGELAKCTNGQLNVQEITCTLACQNDPCAGNVSCPLYPEAMCFASECDCTPLWLLPIGVEVKCSQVGKRDVSTDNVAGSGCAE